MRYQIVYAYPHYDNYDAIRGWSFKRSEYAYENINLALKIAERFSDGTSETSASVVPYGGDIFTGRTRLTDQWNDLPANDYEDGIPF